jgi:dipeptidase E
MKTIILTSKDDQITTTEFDEFLPKPLSASRVLYVTTGLKGSSDLVYADQQKQIMQRLNFSYTEYDISNKSKEDLKKALSNIDVVYVVGGSTFYLLKAVRESGFDEVIKELLPKGLVYIGLSAGAYIACPSIIMKTWSSRNSNQFGITDFTAMNLVPFLLKAHYEPEMKKLLEEKSKNLDLDIRVLNNEQALIIRDEKIQLIGGGDEIIIYNGNTLLHTSHTHKL